MKELPDDEQQIGAYEAKTHLPRILRQVAAGRRFRITQRGKPVAVLVPIQETNGLDPTEAACRMRAFTDSRRTRPRANIRELIDEGRD